MSYLETEINESIEKLGIQNKKISPKDLDTLMESLGKTFFCEGANCLDPTQLRVKSAEHNPNFWQEVSGRIHSDQLILIVLDTSYRAWEIGPPQQLQRVLADTTGYPFWVTDVSFSFLIHMDDHDCASLA